MKREELLRSEGYWIAKIQTDLYREIQSFMKRTNRNATQMAQYLGCSKGYLSQLLNGNFDHKISKMVELSLAIDKAPIIEYKDLDLFIKENDSTYSASQATGTKKIWYPATINKTVKKEYIGA